MKCPSIVKNNTDHSLALASAGLQRSGRTHLNLALLIFDWSRAEMNFLDSSSYLIFRLRRFS